MFNCKAMWLGGIMLPCVAVTTGYDPTEPARVTSPRKELDWHIACNIASLNLLLIEGMRILGGRSSKVLLSSPLLSHLQRIILPDLSLSAFYSTPGLAP